MDRERRRVASRLETCSPHGLEVDLLEGDLGPAGRDQGGRGATGLRFIAAQRLEHHFASCLEVSTMGMPRGLVQVGLRDGLGVLVQDSMALHLEPMPCPWKQGPFAGHGSQALAERAGGKVGDEARGGRGPCRRHEAAVR